MSSITAKFENNKIILKKVKYRKSKDDIEEIPISLLEYGKEYKAKNKATNIDEIDKIFLIQKVDSDFQNEVSIEDEIDGEIKKEESVVIVFSEKEKIKYSYCSLEEAYKKLIKFKYKILKVSLDKRKLKIWILGYFENRYNIEIKDTTFYIDESMGKKCQIKEFPNKLSKLSNIKNKTIQKFTFSIKDILEDESLINGSVRLAIKVDDNIINYRVGIRDRKIKNKRYYYSPMKAKYVKNYALHIRRTTKGNLVLVKRLKEPIENTIRFRFFESKIVSGLLYKISKLNIKLRKKPINLFYEKFSSKAEEGAFDLFIKARKSSQKSKNYFVIDEHSEDYDKIKNERNVIKKYSAKYYWLVFNANNFISTEAPIHLNILRSNNRALRRSQCDKPFIFLQHGITYLKCQGDGSTFAKDKEGQASYIVVGSEKEKDAVVDMLNMQEEQVLNTGLPIFSKIDYKHINDYSEDVITIMLTWKPYEEQLYNFEESTYYKNTIEIYEMLKKYIPSEKIVIIPHPKVYDLLANTDMKDSIWLGKISEVLAKTNLLITDYSSVCYNAFYQGAGVIFYQPDLEKYEQENGPLIPNDDEYVGYRAFNMKQLEEIIDYSVKNKKINLNVVRTEEFEKRYKTINEFSDGKNIDRIYSILKDMEII